MDRVIFSLEAIRDDPLSLKGYPFLFGHDELILGGIGESVIF
jgi:hypothetical protein